MSFGEELRRERELRQISLREIARATKIDLRRLEELERNDFSALPGGLYNRGYVRAYCEHIGVDAEAMVNAYLLEERAQASPSRGTGPGGTLLRGRPPADAPGREATARSAPRGGGRAWLVILGAALLVAGLLIWWSLVAGGKAAVGPGAGSAATVDSRGSGG